MLIEQKKIDRLLGMIPDEELYVLLNRYGFTDSWMTLPFININNKVVALNRRSETARKSLIFYEDKYYILKEIPWYCSEINFVKNEILFQNHLLNNNVPIPEIIKSESGEYFISHNRGVKENYFYLQEYIIGKSWTKTKQQIGSASIILAKIHKLSESYFPKTDGSIPESNVFELARKMISVLSKTILDFKNIMDQTEFADVSRYIADCTELTAEIEKKCIRLGYNDIKLIVHGDYNPMNMVFDDNDHMSAIIDFDNMIVDNPVHDIAEAIIDFSFMKYRRFSTRFDEIPDVFDKEVAKCFLSAYSQNNNDMYNMVMPCLKDIILVVFIELFTLAIVRGDYAFKDCHLFQKSYKILEAELNELN